MLYKFKPALSNLISSFLIVFFSATGAFAQSNCGPLRAGGQFGPFDYRPDHHKPENEYDHRTHKSILDLVQSAHFTAEVEALIRGHTVKNPGADIDYTLRAFPNNHRALIAMMRLGEKEKTSQPIGSQYTVECWFDRAVRFSPDDVVVRMLFSSYLNSKGRAPEATAQLEMATKYAKDNPMTHYNIGRHYFDMKNYDKALVQAHKAIELGFTQTILRDQLQSVGKWVAPSDAPAPPESASSAPAPATQ